MFPTYLLEKVYQPKSLKNTPGGFEFTLKNVIDTGVLAGVRKLSVDGARIPLESISLRTPAGERAATDISSRSPVALYYGAQCSILVKGEPLSAGLHEITLTISVFDAGDLDFAIKDVI